MSNVSFLKNRSVVCRVFFLLCAWAAWSLGILKGEISASYMPGFLQVISIPVFLIIICINATQAASKNHCPDCKYRAFRDCIMLSAGLICIICIIGAEKEHDTVISSFVLTVIFFVIALAVDVCLQLLTFSFFKINNNKQYAQNPSPPGNGMQYMKELMPSRRYALCNHIIAILPICQCRQRQEQIAHKKVSHDDLAH